MPFYFALGTMVMIKSAPFGKKVLFEKRRKMKYIYQKHFYRVINYYHKMYCPQATGNISNEKINFTDYFIRYHFSSKNDIRIHRT